MNILATLCNPSELNIPHVPTGKGILEEGMVGQGFFFLFNIRLQMMASLKNRVI